VHIEERPRLRRKIKVPQEPFEAIALKIALRRIAYRTAVLRDPAQ
jgi:hypothetical protein